MEKRTEIPIRRAGSPVACNKNLDFQGELKHFTLEESTPCGFLALGRRVTRKS